MKHFVTEFKGLTDICLSGLMPGILFQAFKFASKRVTEPTPKTGFAGGFWSLFLLVSFAIVVPQTVYSPTAHALIASLHKETRTVAMSCHQAAYYTGWFVSGAAVAGVLALFGSWRAAFFTFGALGFILGVVSPCWAGRTQGASSTEQSNNPNNQTIPNLFSISSIVPPFVSGMKKTAQTS